MDKDFDEKRWIKTEIAVLTDTGMHGRGYVRGGREAASKHIQKKFKDFKLKPCGNATSFVQGFAFPVNTFPGHMDLTINKKDLTAGEDFLIDAASHSYKGDGLEVKTIDMFTTDTEEWKNLWGSFRDTEAAYILENTDSAMSYWHVRKERFFAALPKGCYIVPVPEKEKLTWTVSRDTMNATVFYVKEAVNLEKAKSISVDVQAQFIPKARSENIAGYFPGKVKDTFIVFTAHYDHLGMMGSDAVFPGASDNASGTAMLLYLVDYFSAHPQKYSIMFIAFAGEEAGILGSTFYTLNPLVPLKQIKFLTNLDILGDATQGITVVNATEFPQQYDQLEAINNVRRYVPEIKPRGTTQNSDHFHFFEKGVPCFYIYSNGGKGYYHDIYDTGESLSLRFVNGIAKLLVDFTESMK